jgi:Ca2+-binding RTX toxin-like protein
MANLIQDLSVTGDEELIGSEFDDLIIGGIGDNIIDGVGGDDNVFGGDGNDIIAVGDGNDNVDGGLGDDDITLGEATGALVREGVTNPSNFGYGGGGNDTITGGANTDYIYGEEGDDILDGGAGDDVILGDVEDPLLGGADTITGGFGSDFLSGGTGADIINSHASRGAAGTTRLIEKDEIYAGNDADADQINLFTNYAGGKVSARPARQRSFGDGSFAVIDQFNVTSDTLNLRDSLINYTLVQGNYDGDRKNDTFITQRGNTVAVVLDVSRTPLSGVIGQVV